MGKALYSIIIGFIILSLTISFLTPSLMYASPGNKLAS
jgi:hypothetical protein